MQSFHDNRLMMKTFFIFLSLLVAVTAKAQTEEHAFKASLYGGLYVNNEQAWSVEPSLTRFFHKYLGVAFGMELTSQYNQPSRITTIDGHEARLSGNEQNVAWVIFKPSVVLKSPYVWNGADGLYRLWLQAEPGINLACPFKNSLTYEIMDFNGNVGSVSGYRKFSNKDLEWFYWNARFSVNMQFERFVVGAGYQISNFDYYSSRRNVTLADGQKFHVPAKELSHNVFLSVGYMF